MSIYSNLSKDQWIKLISAYQVGGGLLGFCLMPFATTTSYFFYVMPTLLFGLSISAGILLYKRKKIGFTLSTLNQFLQLFSISVAGLFFKYASGIDLRAIVDFTNSIKFIFEFELSASKFMVDSEIRQYAFGFNFVALFLFIKINSLNSQQHSQDKSLKHG